MMAQWEDESDEQPHFTLSIGGYELNVSAAGFLDKWKAEITNGYTGNGIWLDFYDGIEEAKANAEGTLRDMLEEWLQELQAAVNT